MFNQSKDSFYNYYFPELKKKESVVSPSYQKGSLALAGAGAASPSVGTGKVGPSQLPDATNPFAYEKLIDENRLIKPVQSKAIAEGVAKDKNNSAIGGVYNTLVGSVARTAGGGAEVFNTLMDAFGQFQDWDFGTPGHYEIMKNDPFMKRLLPRPSRQEVVDFVEKARTASSSRENEQARSQFDITDGLQASDVKALMFQAPSTIVDMLGGAASSGTTFFLQSVNDNAKELEQNPNAPKLTPSEKLGYLFVQGTTQAALEKFGIDKMLKATGLSSKVKQRIAAEITDEFIKKGIKATAKEIEELAIKKASSLASQIKKVGVKGATGIGVESLTEGTQQATSDGIKLLTNRVVRDEVFDEEDIAANFIKNTINASAQGGAFGGVFGGGVGVMQNTKKAIRKEIANSQSSGDVSKIKQEIAEQVELGNITEEEANAANITAEQYAKIAAKIPGDIDADKKYAIIGGIEQRENLKKEIEGVKAEMKKVDAAFHDDPKARIELLEAKLEQTNDYLEGVVHGKKPTYRKEKPATEGGEVKYYKTSPTGEETKITKEHYDLATAVREGQAEQNKQQKEEVKEQTPEEKVLSVAKLDGMYAEMAKADPVGMVKYIAQQAQNIDENGQPHPEESRGESLRRAKESFGEEAVNEAVKLYPSSPPMQNQTQEGAAENVVPSTLKVGEEMGEGSLPSVDDVYSLLEDEESRQGGSWLNSEYGDFRFETEEQARAYAEEVHSFFSGLAEQKEIPVYRAVAADEVDLTPYGIGESWSVDLNAAKEFARNLGVPLSKIKIISGKVPRENVDWETAIRNYHNFSSITSEESEFELPIPSNRVINDVKVQDYKSAKELGQSVQVNVQPKQQSNIPKGGNVVPSTSEQISQPIELDPNLPEGYQLPEQPIADAEVNIPEIRTHVPEEPPSGGEPPAPAAVPVVEGGGDIGGITHAANEVRRRDRGMPEYSYQPESFEQWNNEGERLLRDGYDVDNLLDRLEAGATATPVENAIRKIYIATLDAEIARNPTNELLARQRRFIVIGDEVNKRAGQNLVSLKGQGSPLGTISDFYVAKMEALGVNELTDEQKAETKAAFDKVQQTSEDADARIKILEEENARLRAESEVRKTKNETKKQKKDYKKERDEIRQSIKDKWKNAGKDILSSDIPYRAQLFAIAPDVARLMKSYIEEGVTEFKEIIKKLHDDVKEIEPNVTENDITDILSGKYDVKKETKGDLQRKLKQIKNKKSEEAIKIIARIKSGDFSNPEKKVSWVENKELQKRFPKEYNDALDALVAKEEAKHEFDIALLRDQLSKRNWRQKGTDWLGKLAGTAKAIVTGIDDSAVAIQTYVSLLTRPRTGATALWLHAAHAKSSKKFNRWLAELHASPDFQFMKDAGLDVTEPQSLKEREKEEIFNNRFDGTIKIKGREYKLIGAPLKPFERAFTTLGNVTRVVGFRTIANKYLDEGYTWEKDPELFKSLARRLNNETGRGTQNEYVENASKVVTLGIWSPRLMAAKFNILGVSDVASIVLSKAGTKGYYSQLHPRERAAAIRDIVQFAITVMAITYLVALSAGGDVDDDPLSSTFMDVRMPNGKSYNFTGGFSSYIRSICQFIAGGKRVDGEFKKQSRLGTMGRFFRGKMPPLTAAAANTAEGKDFMGKPTTTWDEIKNLAPISMKNIAQQIKNDGAESFFTQGIPTFFGFNVTNEKDYESQIPRGKPTKPAKPSKPKKPSKPD